MMIDAIIKNLQKGKNLLQNISNDDYINNSIAPYYASIGSHIRHILDMFTCVFNGLESNTVNFACRERNIEIELNKNLGLAYFDEIIDKLHNISPQKLVSEISINDNLGLGDETTLSTVKAALMQTNSHAIHHYASIGYIIFQLGIELPDDDFGVNPTSPKKMLKSS